MRLVSSELPQRPMDLTEWAYNSIKQLILNNTLTADSQIHIDEMAAQFNISRTPVREALMQLQNKGLVRIVPHVGCFVCGVTREEFREVFELRAVIETYAARRDPDEAARLMEQHVRNVQRRIEKIVFDS